MCQILTCFLWTEIVVGPHTYYTELDGSLTSLIQKQVLCPYEMATTGAVLEQLSSGR